MKLLKTEITIDAPPQAVWSVLDDLERYPEWNNAVPHLSGRTTVGQRVEGVLRRGGEDRPLNPEIIRIVGARELRWITIVPDNVLSAEHIFVLEPLEGGARTHVRHEEQFDGTAVEAAWPMIDTAVREAYEEMNLRLKTRVEAIVASEERLHPAIGQPALDRPKQSFTLKCHCTRAPIELAVSEPMQHNHLCGCSKCWKPEKAALAQIAVVPAGSIEVVANADKLESVDDSQKIQRMRCRDCGVHVCGRVSDPDHHFFGLAFVHPELSPDGGQPKVEFAAFVSSIIESGAPATSMVAVRRALSDAGIPAYDVFSPELMDIIAWHKVKLENTTQ